MVIVALTHVAKTYQNGKVRVLEDVQLELQKGDFLYVVGGSGAGKSTLLRLLSTEETPTEGEISLFGYAMQRVQPSTLRAIRQCIGYVPQNIRLVPDISVLDNIALSVSLAGRRMLSASIRTKIAEVLHRLGLTEKKDIQARFLSGGEAQRVAVARALVRSPELIVADEPTGAQDRDYTWTLMDLLLRANAGGGATIVVATHDREIVRRVRKRCAVLRNGTLTLEESVCMY